MNKMFYFTCRIYSYSETTTCVYRGYTINDLTINTHIYFRLTSYQAKFFSGWLSTIIAPTTSVYSVCTVVPTTINVMHIPSWPKTVWKFSKKYIRLLLEPRYVLSQRVSVPTAQTRPYPLGYFHQPIWRRYRLLSLTINECNMQV